MLTAVACDKSNGPEEIMSQEQMVSYLIQLHIAEAEVQNLRLKKDSSQTVFNIYEKHLLEENNLTDTLFTASYNYYLQNSSEMELIYEAVVDSISVRKSIDDVTK